MAKEKLCPYTHRCELCLMRDRAPLNCEHTVHA